MTYSRTTMTPAPSPCRARPAMKTAMLPARPATSSPAAKAATPQGSATRGPRRSPASPPTTMPTTEATRKALNGQPYQANPSSSVTAVGIAVATAIDSKATKVTSINMPAVVSRGARSKTAGGLLVSTSSPTSVTRRYFPHTRRAPTPEGSTLDVLFRPRCRDGARLLAGVDLFGGGRDDGVQVAHDTEVGQL